MEVGVFAQNQDPAGVESLQEVDARESTMRRAARAWRTRIGLAMVIVMLVIALTGPLFAPHPPGEIVGRPFEGPSSAALLGTDNLGRDVLSRVLSGGRTVIGLATAAALTAYVLGVTIGLCAGYFRNWIDDVLMRIVDVLLAFPGIVLVILFTSMLGPKLWLIALLVGVAQAPSVARLTRGVTLEVVELEFIQSAQAMGLPRRQILFRELLPNLATPLLVDFGVRFAWAIAIIAATSFLGFGIQPPSSDWGLMINENRNGIGVQPWAILLPAIAISTLTIGANLIAEGISRAVTRLDSVSAQ